MAVLSFIKGKRRIVLLIVTVLILIITFQTFQQLFYINRFNLSENTTFIFLLKGQAYRWLIWFLLSNFILWHLYSKKINDRLSITEVLKFSGLIISLVLINIIIIATINIIANADVFTIKNFLFEYVQFYLYQKGPLYTLGYIAITVILYYYFANEQLQIKVQKLSDLKLTNERLYGQLKNKLNDDTSVLNIKIGNKRKIIPVKEVLWIEADDYCVKVHTTTNGVYTMRSSLKALDEKLSTMFIRVHRKAIVNMSFAKELHLSGSPNLILKNNIQIPVSKSNLKVVKDFLS